MKKEKRKENGVMLFGFCIRTIRLLRMEQISCIEVDEYS